MTDRPSIPCVRPDEVPLARDMVIDQPDGPIDQINAALVKPWMKSEIEHGRRVDAPYPPGYDTATREAVLGHYQKAGWSVVWHSARDQRDDSYFLFRKPALAPKGGYVGPDPFDRDLSG
jgi:hypothetical protein